MVHDPELVEEMPDGERVYSLLSERKLRLGKDSVDVDLIDFPPGCRTPPRIHRSFNEFFHVLAGDAVVRIGEVRHGIGAGKSFAVAKGTVHCFEVGASGLRLVTVCAPFFDGADSTLVSAE